MKQVLAEGLNGFVFDNSDLLSNHCAHVFGAKNSDNQGNFAFSDGRDIAAARHVRSTWCDFIGANADDMVVGGQTHTNNVQFVEGTHKGRGALSPTDVLPNCDGLITVTPSLPLYVAVADCSAVLLSAPGIVGVVHGGWRGLQTNILQRAVDLFVGKGAALSEIFAGIAPCIQATSYEVGPEVADGCPSSAKHRGEGDRWQVDVALWAKANLLELGLLEPNVEMSEIDSGVDHRVFSHRRQGEAAGRNGLLAMLTE